MLRQYHASPCRLRTLRDGRTVRVGTIAIGTLVRFPALGATLEVLGWYNRIVGATHRDAAGQWQSSMMAGGHLALCRDLRTGATVRVPDWQLLGAIDRGQERHEGRGNPRAARRARRQARREEARARCAWGRLRRRRAQPAAPSAPAIAA